MQKSNLINLLLTLPKADRKAFRKFVQSPFHNQREDVQRLYFYIDKKIDSDWQALKKEKAFAVVFPNEGFEDKKIRYVMSFLLKTLEEYLIIKEAKNSEIGENILLTRAYRKLKQPKLFQQNLKKTTELLTQKTFRSQDYYEHLFELELETYHFNLGQQRNAPSNLQHLSQTYDLAFIIQKLRQSCLMLAHQSVYKSEYDTGLLPLILNYLTDHELLEKHPAIAAYFYFYQAGQPNQQEQNFQLFKNIVFEHFDLFPKEEQRNLYLLATNFCIKKYNQGEQKYLREVFSWYKNGLERTVLVENGLLSHFTFKNIAATALKLQEFAWTENFIENYQHFLTPKFRETYTHYSLSKLRYNQGNYQEAMQRLLQMEYNDLFLNLDAKVMLLKMYFELGELEALDALLASFKIYIERNKKLGYHQENYLNIIRLTRKLTEMNPFDKNAKIGLKAEIENTIILGERQWLLRQLERGV